MVFKKINLARSGFTLLLLVMITFTLPESPAKASSIWAAVGTAGFSAAETNYTEIAIYNGVP